MAAEEEGGVFKSSAWVRGEGDAVFFVYVSFAVVLSRWSQGSTVDNGLLVESVNMTP